MGWMQRRDRLTTTEPAQSVLRLPAERHHQCGGEKCKLTFQVAGATLEFYRFRNRATLPGSRTLDGLRDPNSPELLIEAHARVAGVKNVANLPMEGISSLREAFSNIVIRGTKLVERRSVGFVRFALVRFAWLSAHKDELNLREGAFRATRSEEHTSELQSRRDLVCRI